MICENEKNKNLWRRIDNAYGGEIRMGEKFDFNGLFIYDMANNHQGSVEHGLRIIREVAKVSNEEKVRGALKFQFRNLDTFIHPDYKKSQKPKHIPRFLSTCLSAEDFKVLTEEVRKHNLTTITTPFDEDSVELINKLDIEIIKVGSCSAMDWPLLEKIAEAKKPVICSTAGLSTSNIDKIVDFFERRNINFALMHCMALYPTPNDKLQLNQIEMLCKRYPSVPIGYSTHEDPDYLDAVKIAYAKGAKLFERHVGVETDKIKLNAYSSTPKQLQAWIHSYNDAVEACGAEERPPVSHDEDASLRSLKRCIFAAKDIKKDDVIKRSDVFFAMPLLEGMLESGSWKDELIADKDYKKKEALSEKLILQKPESKIDLIGRIALQTKGMLNEARITVDKESNVELSHHYGLRRFREFGAILIDCINRDYCKKLIIQLPRQKHPYHYHKRKEETFQVLFGDLEVIKEGDRTKLYPGDKFTVNRGEWHKFHTLHGVIFEEVSTTHYDDDSFYDDRMIRLMDRNQRKTKLINLGKNTFSYKEK